MSGNTVEVGVSNIDCTQRWGHSGRFWNGNFNNNKIIDFFFTTANLSDRSSARWAVHKSHINYIRIETPQAQREKDNNSDLKQFKSQ